MMITGHNDYGSKKETTGHNDYAYIDYELQLLLVTMTTGLNDYMKI